MIVIEKSFYPEKGLTSVDPLTGYIFTPESYAHQIIVRQLVKGEDGVYEQQDFPETAAVTMRLVRADGLTEIVGGSVVSGSARVTFAPECYAVPGRFILVVLVTSGNNTQCVYAASGHVTAGDSGQTEISAGTLRTVDEQLQSLLEGLTAAHWVAIFARNIGDIEGRYDAATTQMESDISAATTAMQTTVQTAIDNMETGVTEAVNDYYDMIDQQNEAIDAQTTAVNAAIGNWESMVTALRNAVEEADLKILNTPNLLPHQPDGETVNVPSSEVIEYRLTVPGEDETAIANPLTYTITDSRLTANHRLCYGITCSNYSVISYSDFTLTPAAGSATLTLAARRQAHDAAVTVTVYIATLTSAVLPYGEISRWWSYSNTPYLNSHANARFTGDERDEISERIVTLSEPIVDQDEATYNKAVAFTVGTVPTSGMNNWDRLIFNHGHGAYEKEVDGQTVTVPESGVLPMVDGMEYTMSCWVRVTSGTKMKLGFSWGMDAYGNDFRPEGTFEYIEVTNTTWKRMYWTFTYQSTVGSITMHPRIAFGVCRAFAGTVQLAGFRLTAGGLYGNNTVDTIRLQLAALENRVAELEATVLENIGN